MTALTFDQWVALEEMVFVQGKIPVWDQSMQNIVGYRTSYTSNSFTLISPFTATAGAILYTPDADGTLVTLTVGQTATGGAVTGTTSASGALATALNKLPAWAMPAGIAGGLVLLVLLLGKK